MTTDTDTDTTLRRALEEQDRRWQQVHDMVEAAREATRLKIPYDQRPADLFKNLQDALYAIRGRTSLDDLLAAFTAPHTQGADDWRAGIEAALSIVAKRIGKYERDLMAHYAPSQPDGVCHCRECFQNRAILVELKYTHMAIRNLQPPVSVEATGAGRERQLERANRIIGWMMPYIGNMCPPQNGLGDLNNHCFDNHIHPRMDDETKGQSIRQHAAGCGPSGISIATSLRKGTTHSPSDQSNKPK